MIDARTKCDFYLLLFWFSFKYKKNIYYLGKQKYSKENYIFDYTIYPNKLAKVSSNTKLPIKK